MISSREFLILIVHVCVGEHSNFEKFPTHTQDHCDGIATREESVSTYPRRPKVEAYITRLM